MLNLENTVTRLKSIVLSKTYGADHVSDTLDLLRCNSYWISSDLKDGYFAKCSDAPLIECFKRVLWCLLSQQQFGALTVKFSLNPIRPKTWPIWEIPSHISESSFTASSYGAFYVSAILKLFRYNSHLTFKTLFIFEILSYASNLSF